MSHDTEDRPKPLLGLSGTQTIGSALGAVTSALVGSFLGMAGTLIGAALGSIIATVGAAVYARTLSKPAGWPAAPYRCGAGGTCPSATANCWPPRMPRLRS